MKKHITKQQAKNLYVLLADNRYDEILSIFGLPFLFDLAEWYLFIGYKEGVIKIIESIDRYVEKMK